MISPAEQSALIKGIGQADGFVRDPFIGASGVGGNLKVTLPEALDRYFELKQQYIGHIARTFTDVDIIMATGGAVDIAAEVAFATGQRLIEIVAVKRQGKKHFSLSVEDQAVVAKKPRIGIFEDVSSTLQTVVRAVRRLNIQNETHVVTIGFRRGEPAPRGMTAQDVLEHDKSFHDSELLEVPNNLPIVPIVERKLPLWIPSEALLRQYLPELDATSY